MNEKPFTLTATLDADPDAIKELIDKCKEPENEAQQILDKNLQKFLNFNKEVFEEIRQECEGGDRFVQQITDIFSYAFSRGWNECYTFHKELIER